MTEGYGFDSAKGEIFSSTQNQDGLWGVPNSHYGRELFPWRYSGWSVTITAHHNILQSLRIHGAIFSNLNRKCLVQNSVRYLLHFISCLLSVFSSSLNYHWTIASKRCLWTAFSFSPIWFSGISLMTYTKAQLGSNAHKHLLVSDPIEMGTQDKYVHIQVTL